MTEDLHIHIKHTAIWILFCQKKPLLPPSFKNTFMRIHFIIGTSESDNQYLQLLNERV